MRLIKNVHKKNKFGGGGGGGEGGEEKVFGEKLPLHS